MARIGQGTTREAITVGRCPVCGADFEAEVTFELHNEGAQRNADGVALLISTKATGLKMTHKCENVEAAKVLDAGDPGQHDAPALERDGMVLTPEGWVQKDAPPIPTPDTEAVVTPLRRQTAEMEMDIDDDDPDL